eukprot:jgi/Tetstr1/461480/TSEL_006586.t1
MDNTAGKHAQLPPLLPPMHHHHRPDVAEPGPVEKLRVRMGAELSETASSEDILAGQDAPLNTPNGTTVLRQGERYLNLQRLKERLELEIGLFAEGLRFIIFVLFCVCFCASISWFTRQVQRNASVYEIRQTLGTGNIRDIKTRSQVFEFLLESSDKARQFFPLSSHYWDDKLSKAYLGEVTDFPSGSVYVPDEAKMSLTAEWSITARLRLKDSYDQRPPRRLIMAEQQATGAQNTICWALYCEGIGAYVLLYGQHNLDLGYQEVVVNMDQAVMGDMDTGDMNLVALSVNSTHFTVMLQDADSTNQAMDFVAVQSQLLPYGIVPSQCSDSQLLIGDSGLELADMRYHPKTFHHAQFGDLKEAGQTLENIAMGVAAPQVPGEMATRGAASSSGEVISDSGQAFSAVEIAKLVGSVASPVVVTASNARYAMPDSMPTTQFGQVEDPVLGWPLMQMTNQDMGGFVGVDSDTTQAEESVPYFQVLDTEEGVWTDDWSGVYWHNTNMSSGITTAFKDLGEKGQLSFTLEWWAKRFTAMEKFTLSTSSLANDLDDVNDIAFIVRGRKDAGISFWEISTGHPDCPSTKPVCAEMPRFACKVDHMGGYGQWRHMAVRYGHGTQNNGSTSELELFQDGVSLCGVEFPTSNEAMPHTLANITSVNGFFLDSLNHGAESWVDTVLKNINIYAGALKPETIYDLAHDPERMECMALEMNANDYNYQTSFGQTCTNLADLSGAGGLSAACMADGASTACPLSCWDQTNHCWDGVPSIYAQPTTRATGTWYYNRDVQPAGARPLNTRGQVWEALWGSVEQVQYGAIISSMAGPPALEQSNSGNAKFDTPDNLGCIVDEVTLSDDERDFLYLTQLKATRSKLCQAKATWLSQQQQGSNATLDNIAYLGADVPGFKPGLLNGFNNSFTMVFWVQSLDNAGMDAISLAGIDSEDNICFHIDGLLAVMPPSVNDNTTFSYPAAVLQNLPAESKQRRKWTFFGVSYDQRSRTFMFMVNGIYQTTQRPSGTLINVGGDIVRRRPASTAGRSLPQPPEAVHQDALHRDRAAGPPHLAPRPPPGQHLPRASFNFDTVGISPPLVLIEQMRGTALSNDDTQSIPGQDAEDSWGGYCDK